MDKFLNFNVGILGHVDSGKTSLAKVLSTVASTAAFDKNPQSQSRGITIDLGFSSFTADAPAHISERGFSMLRFTLVDCPGHASLIRTIIGGAQIIDAIVLVVDITKGMQTQTAECLVVGEIFCKNLIVVLNKIDLVIESKRKDTIEKVTRKVLNTLKSTDFKNVNVVPLSANPIDSEPINIGDLVKSLQEISYIPKRHEKRPLVFSVDHCFGIKGQGTIITGTILQGSVSVNDSIEIPSLKVVKKVKSIQMFREPVETAIQGDRAGLCVTQFNPKLLERSIIGFPGYIKCALGFIASVEKVQYFKQTVNSKAKYHISLGHETILSKVIFFGSNAKLEQDDFNFDYEYAFQNTLLSSKELGDQGSVIQHQFAVVEFEKLIPIKADSEFIASKLDMDIHTNMCRIAFWGKILCPLPENYKTEVFPKLKVFRSKMCEGKVERMNNESELIVKDLLKKGADMNIFRGLKTELSSGEKAVIEGYFGQGGKVKLRLTSTLLPETMIALLSISEGKKRSKKSQQCDTNVGNTEKRTNINVFLKFKKYIFDPSKKIVQDK